MRWRRLAAIVLAALTVVGCFDAKPALDYERAQRATVLVELRVEGTPAIRGSGVVTQHGVLTAGHLAETVNENVSAHVQFYGGEWVKATVVDEVYESREAETRLGTTQVAVHDVALLAIDPSHGYPRAEVACRDPGIGEQLYQVGHPLNLEWAVTRGRVTAERPRLGHEPGRWVATDIVTEQGNSGGPLFDATGRVVGIASHGLSGGLMGTSGHYFAVSGAAACKWLAHVVDGDRGS